MGKTIGRFEVRRELGRGAQSVVYLGWDPQLQREVAIKTLHVGEAGQAQVDRLLQEARAVSPLRHAHLVPIFEAGLDPATPGELYLVFEYVPGETLAAHLQQHGALPPTQAVQLLRPVLSALVHAHANGVIHRDLKPSNILLDEEGVPRVMDFGIARRVEADSPEGEGYTGTPAYMAPEYAGQHQITPQVDVFAAGLILYEMLTGRRAIRGANPMEMIYRIIQEDVRLPPDVEVDDRLADMLYRALARDPAQRYASAAQFLAALDSYLDPQDAGEGGEAESGSGAKSATLEFLLRRMRHKSDFPALSESVSAINRITASETESIGRLSATILKDYALTNKILRLVNSAYFRQAGGGNISTVSRALVVLGFDAVRNIAITVLLFEHLQSKANANQLRDEFLRANLMALLAREVGLRGGMRDAEQAFICAMFHHLGRMLCQYYFPEESDQIRRVMEQKGLSEAAASLQVLGLSFEDMGLGVARTWGFPPVIVTSMRRLAPGRVRRPESTEERLRLLSGLADELCVTVANSTSPHDRDVRLGQIRQRFGEAIGLGERELHQSVENAFRELQEFARVIHLNPQQTPFGRQLMAWSGKGEGASEGGGERGGGSGQTIPGTVLADTPLAEVEEGQTLAGSYDSAAAQAILTAGIQDISNTLVEDFKLNDLLRIILETMYRAMGFRRVLLCIKDGKSNTMQGRFGFGPDATATVPRFRFPLSFTPDIFHAAIANGVDLLISDTRDPKIAPRIPPWFRAALPSETFVLFPLNINKKPVALIYADKDKAGDIVIPEKELALLRTLRNQAILAIKQTLT